jgi:hypothetical protein
MTKDQAYHLIDAYIQNSLSHEDKTTFEYLLSQNSDLQLEVELEQLTSEILISNHIDAIQKEIKTYHQLQLRKTKWIKFGIAVVLTCVCITCVYLWNTKNSEAFSTPTTNQLAITPNENTYVIDSITTGISKTTTPNITPKNSNPKKETNPTINIKSPTSYNDEEKAKDIPLVNINKEEPVSPSNQQQVVTTPIVKDPCDGVQINGKYEIVGTCPNKNDGQIIINKITGGASPYQYELKHNNHVVSLSHLEDGIYSLTIKDKNNCEVTYSNIKVPNLSCQENFAFNPFIGETWKTIVGNQSGQIIIYDISGNIYYQKSFTSNEEIEWNGVSVRGNTQSGQYIYIIKYSDGLSTTGNITLVD